MNDEVLNVKLVKAVEKYPVLYDYRLPGYGKKYEVNKAWQEVAQMTNLSVNVCKQSWRKCRDSWARDLKYSMVCAFSKKKKKPYYLADHMGFLTPFTKLKMPKSIESKCHHRVMPHAVTEIKEELNINDEPALIYDNEEDNTRDTLLTDALNKHAPTDDLDSISMSCSENKRIKFELESDNSDMLFFRSLLPEMANLTSRQRIDFKISVLQTLNQMLSNNCDSSNNCGNGVEDKQAA